MTSYRLFGVIGMSASIAVGGNPTGAKPTNIGSDASRNAAKCRSISAFVSCNVASGAPESLKANGSRQPAGRGDRALLSRRVGRALRLDLRPRHGLLQHHNVATSRARP